MSLPVFYYRTDYHITKNVLIEGDIVKHVVQVLRMQPGEEMKLTDGLGSVAVVSIKSVFKKSFEVEILSSESIPEPESKLHLGIAFTKNASRNEWLLEKVTELGVNKIHPVISSRTEKYYPKEERWQNILVSAMLQSQQYYLPVLESPMSLQALVRSNEHIDQKFMAHCEPGMERRNLSEIFKPNKNTFVLIGPEGDFDKEEIIIAAEKGFAGVDLGNNRLRTETAAMAVCAFFKMMNP